MPRKLLARFFHVEEIDGDGRCPTYLYRWHLLATRWFKVYLHHFVGDDWALDLHDHPKRFLSIGLKGAYVEETPNGERTYRAPWIRTFPASHTHRLRLIDGRPCWTFIVVFKTVREWGFWPGGRWMHWRTYVGGDAADRRKACP